MLKKFLSDWNEKKISIVLQFPYGKNTHNDFFPHEITAESDDTYINTYMFKLYIDCPQMESM